MMKSKGYAEDDTEQKSPVLSKSPSFRGQVRLKASADNASPAGGQSSLSRTQSFRQTQELIKEKIITERTLQQLNAYTSPSIAAGVPVLELIRKLTDERILNKEDRMALTEGLHSPGRRDNLVKAMQEVELGTNPRFAIRRLKILIHQNAAGAPTSNSDFHNRDLSLIANDDVLIAPIQLKSALSSGMQGGSETKSGIISTHKTLQDKTDQSTSNSVEPSRRNSSMPPKNNRNYQNDEEDEDSLIIAGAHETIVKLVGDVPSYDDHFGVCDKISRRLRDLVIKMKNSTQKIRAKSFAVLVGSGSCNPLTRMQIRRFFLAKQYLEGKAGYIVLGSLISPSHAATVRERYRNNVSEVIPSPHRLAVAQLMLQESKWCSVDPWEITRRRPMDYLAFLQHCNEMMKQYFPRVEIKIIYLCKANMVPIISPQAIQKESYACVSVCRPTETEQLRNSLTSKWSGLIHIVEDEAILDTSLDTISSRRVRKDLRAGMPVKEFMGGLIDEYFRQHKIADKMNGEEDWTDAEKLLPTIHSRAVDPNASMMGSPSGSSLSVQSQASRTSAALSKLRKQRSLPTILEPPRQEKQRPCQLQEVIDQQQQQDPNRHRQQQQQQLPSSSTQYQQQQYQNQYQRALMQDNEEEEEQVVPVSGITPQMRMSQKKRPSRLKPIDPPLLDLLSLTVPDEPIRVHNQLMLPEPGRKPRLLASLDDHRPPPLPAAAGAGAGGGQIMIRDLQQQQQQQQRHLQHGMPPAQVQVGVKIHDTPGGIVATATAATAKAVGPSGTVNRFYVDKADQLPPLQMIPGAVVRNLPVANKQQPPPRR